ncbi:hypothetical protein ABIB26_001136 [Arthrobacter sp. UYEF20]
MEYTASDGRFCHWVITSAITSVTLEIVAAETVAP